jgi:hypothetical protein
MATPSRGWRWPPKNRSGEMIRDAMGEVKGHLTVPLGTATTPLPKRHSGLREFVAARSQVTN